MIVGKAIYYLLTNATDVTDIVSTRIYPEIAQQDADLPYIVYNVANNEPTDTKPEPSKLDTAQVEVNIYSDSYTECIDLAVAVRAALDRVKGTYAGVNVQSIQYLNEIIDFDEPQRAYNISADYDVRISRTDFEIAQGSPITGVQLGELSDVDVDGVTNGQLIAYNSTSGNWEAADDAGGAERLNDLQDVNFGGIPEDRNVLMYDGAEWVEDNVAKSDVGLGNVDNTSDADKPVSSATQTALDAKADTSAVPTELNDLSDVTITGTPTGNQALIYDGTAGVFKSLPNFTNRFVDEAEINKQSIVPFAERVYTVKADGDGIFIDAQSDTPSSGKVIERKIYHKAGFLESGDVIGDFTLIHTFADDTAYSATESTFEGFRDGDTYGSPPFTLIQTWEEATAAPSFTGLLNESYGSGAAAAYSVRRLNGNYTGAAIQVERSSDNTTQDIGFDSNGDLDESALTTFCTGTTCKVRTWYDQATAGGTGSGNDAQQTDHTKQPTIYTGGAIVKENGRVAVDFDGSNDFLQTATAYNTQQYQNSFYVASSTSNNQRVIDTRGTGASVQGWHHKYSNSSGDVSIIDDGSASFLQTEFFTRLNRNLVSVLMYSGSGSSISEYTSGTLADSVSDATTRNFDSGNVLTIGANSNGQNTQIFSGSLQEIVLYNSDKSTNRTSIESNIGDYFTQNTPLLDTYTGAAAAYSLRKLRSAYSGSAIRVRRASDNTESDIGWNVFGELDTVSLASFCSGTNGFVKTWYDQSGSANDATQTTAASQPKIYDSTTGVVTQDGKPALEMLRASQRNVSATGFAIVGATGDFSAFAVYEESSTDSGNSGIYFGPTSHQMRTSGDLYGSYFYGSGSYSGGINSGTTSTDVVQLISSHADGTNYKIFTNGANEISSTLLGTPDNPTDGVVLGNSSSLNRGLEGHLFEVIFYASDETANRTNIEDNINTFYSIY